MAKRRRRQVAVGAGLLGLETSSRHERLGWAPPPLHLPTFAAPAPSPPFSGLPVLLTALSASEAGGVKSSKAVRLPWWLVIDVSGGVVGISGAPATPSTPPPSMPPCLAATFDV